jgi:rhodanese-related sulfurtransferase
MNIKLVYILIFSLLIVSSCDYFFPPLSSDKIDVNEAFSFLKNHKNDENIVVLDIRSKEEFDRGHLENAILLDYSQTSFPSEIEKLNKDKRYIIIDSNGRKSMNTLELMKELRIEKAHAVKGGYEEWQKTGLPLNY